MNDIQSVEMKRIIGTTRFAVCNIGGIHVIVHTGGCTKLFGLLCILGMFLPRSLAVADLLYVGPGGYPTIQHGLLAASVDDTVLVAPAVYYQNIVWPNTQGIDLVSEAGADSTIVNGQGVAPVMTIHLALDTTTRIDGFTISDGAIGISCKDGACPIVENNRIINSTGPGIYCEAAAPVILDNDIIGNSASDGGGIYCAKAFPSTNPNIIQNLITGNTATRWGGGIFCGESSMPCIVDNVLVNNVAESGGAIYCWGSNPELFQYNTISNNIAEYGGGVFLYECHSTTITANLLDSNTATHNGGAICCEFSSPLITGNTITSNTASTGAGLYTYSMFTHYEPTVSYNNICGNMEYGVFNQTTVDTIDATNNWWGDSTGPYHPTANPGGQGDWVGDRVDFDPWLISPVGVGEQPITRSTERYDNLGATIFSGPLQLPEDAKCKVFDITGRVVEPTKITCGIYFIEVEGHIAQKIIKIR